jgi:hypothetical protein
MQYNLSELHQRDIITVPCIMDISETQDGPSAASTELVVEIADLYYLSTAIPDLIRRAVYNTGKRARQDPTGAVNIRNKKEIREFLRISGPAYPSGWFVDIRPNITLTLNVEDPT